MGAGVVDMVTSLLMRWPVAAWAGGMDVAMVSIAEASLEKVVWEDGTVAGRQVSIKVVLNTVGCILENIVNFILYRRGQNGVAHLYLMVISLL